MTFATSSNVAHIHTHTHTHAHMHADAAVGTSLSALTSYSLYLALTFHYSVVALLHSHATYVAKKEGRAGGRERESEIGRGRKTGDGEDRGNEGRERGIRTNGAGAMESRREVASSSIIAKQIETNEKNEKERKNAQKGCREATECKYLCGIHVA